MNEPQIHVGIMQGTEICFCLNGAFRLLSGELMSDGPHRAKLEQNQILLEEKPVSGDRLIFVPANPSDSSFELMDVTIGINFHWERKENQVFGGSLEILADGESLWAFNHVSLEDYLTSVISSEMKATSNPELLKAHAIISRSWLMAQIEKSKQLQQSGQLYQCISETETEYIRWYDREDHQLFDVCADDHCQRYQGITRQSTAAVVQAIQETRGIFLEEGGKICDARFSKSCGGVTETFENVWEPAVHPYLQSVADKPDEEDSFAPDLSEESSADAWIRQSPAAFCNTTDAKVLSQVLNDYDQETPDFYRWKVNYTQTQILELVCRKTGRDFGQILDLVPVERGKSGRLIRLKIVGTKQTLVIGKELEIRKTLSETHLYSSAFVVDKHEITDGIPQSFTLTGAGWGHGVGLCQIGAAMMAEQGYPYDQILLHYFRGAALVKEY